MLVQETGFVYVRQILKMKGGENKMKKIIAIAVAAAVMGLGATSFADLGSAMQNAANKAGDKAVEKGTEKAVDKVAGKPEQKQDEGKVAKKGKAKKKKKAE